MKKQSILFILFLIPILTFGQKYCLENEQILFEFKTQKNKKLIIAKDKLNKYLVYRYGTKDKIEFEYPSGKLNSWKKFKFSTYLRGGGKANDGMDLNYLYFQVDDYKYVIYQEYLARTEEINYGIRVINLKNDKTTNIKAEPKTIKGSLSVFRDENKIEKGEELFM